MSLDVMVYTPEAVEQYADIATAIAAPGETWVHVENAEESDIATLQSEFGIHQLAVEDVLDEQNRPKTEEYDSHTFVLLKTTRLSQRETVAFHKEVHTTAVGFFIGPDWLVTLSTDDLDTAMLMDDLQASGEFRAQLLEVYTERALREATDRVSAPAAAD